MQDLTPSPRPATSCQRLWTALGLSMALVLAGCGVIVQNRLPAEALARQNQPAGTVYTGWRVFQDKCARCHGPDASGTAQAPDLSLRVRDMGARRFMALVLSRYDWALPAGADAPGREAQIDAVLQGRQGALTMPAWQGEPVVTAHIADLYAYLAARADGSQGPGRPTP
ncbi:c-type cytochrome [Mitsuaria sp. WAJ17]|uniref:c-type cytochrome n=1 Tax=Mitsuaria sp. WAJ17 TaxID=2761452 RepID=UPI0015FEC7FC|nr:cytochrome c [Mitsuaria sp. WAJ17]MBB2488062.1 c-type cytochrome [Mitsuaria sp. WAJ17]